MIQRFNKFIDVLSEHLAARKGLLPFIGIGLVMVDWFIQLIPAVGWIGETSFFLHLGVIIAILGIMLAWAL
jgi:hypothetical protein